MAAAMGVLRLVIVVAGVGLPAWALADPVDVELVAKGFGGKKRPAVVLKVNEPISAANVDLRRDGGERYRQSCGPTEAGNERRFELDAPVGVSHYKGKLSVTFVSGGTASMPLDFEVEVVERFSIGWDESRLDLEAGRVDITLSRPAGRCRHQVIIEGHPPRHGMTRFNGEPPGTWLPISWEPYGDDDVVLKITLKCSDAGGAFRTGKRELYPWHLEIPHEDVIFDTGEAAIEPTEAPKLERAYAEIATAVRRYGDIIDVKLYISGHTDTVGSTDANAALSLRRARAIATHFRGLGVSVPIYYTGMGESALAVATPDQTDEARNRRARYLISVDQPFEASWQRLR